MTLDAYELKRRYQDKWARSNARERFVLLFLNTFLPQGFRAELTGLGAGSSEYIERSYRGVLEAFDITILFSGEPVALVDVTGVTHPGEARPGLGYCVGEWKLDKAYRLGVERRAWAAFAIEGEPAILWAPITKFNTSIARRARLYEDEQPVRCLPRRAWHPFNRPNWSTGKIPFLAWLRLAAAEGPIRLPAKARA